jgi:asparagine synthase (glutamine-hydrolysing)
MCGFAGLIRMARLDDPGAVLRAMTSALRHRGPDDEGFFDATASAGAVRVGLGFRRLAIIDLSLGHQPMANEDGSVHIVFNGEIYNFQSLRAELVAHGHRFATQSDTEVIVHAYEQWGAACVRRLRGMFAFAIWDARKEELFLARDRFGKKPLFLAEAGGTLLFGSEAGALLASGLIRPEVDEGALWDYFTYRYVPGPRTLLKGIRKLPPGCHATWRAGRLTEARYYDIPDRQPGPGGRAPADAVPAFLAKLDEAVRIRMVADVPFGAFLSGGLDSSAVVALMTRHSSQPVRTFSIGFAEGAFSELEHARQVATRLRTEHTEVSITGADLTTHLQHLQSLRSAPIAEPTDIPLYLLSRKAAESVKMVLSGEGADEFLAGYPKHVFECYGNSLRAVPAVLRSRVLEPLVNALPFRYHRLKTAAACLGTESFEARMPRWFGVLSDAERSALLKVPGPLGTASVQFDTPAGNSPLRRALYFDQASWLPDNMLERGDSMTMAASIEARMPFVDHELVEMASALPDDCRIRGMQTKWILRAAMKDVLPREILERPKGGFRVPVRDWFRGMLREYVEDSLLSPGARSAAYLERPALERILAEHMAGRHNHEKLIWSLVSLESWLGALGEAEAPA